MQDKPANEPNARCQNFYPDLLDLSFSDQRRALRLRRRWWRLKKGIWHVQARGSVASIKKGLASLSRQAGHPKDKESTADRSLSGELHFEPGDWVEVRSEKEIFATLDEHDKQQGLQFTKEMSEFCGGKFRVMKKVQQILIETTGELRALKIPTLILEGVFCDGKRHGGCDRTCFIFWRQAWLKKAKPDALDRTEADARS